MTTINGNASVLTSNTYVDVLYTTHLEKRNKSSTLSNECPNKFWDTSFSCCPLTAHKLSTLPKNRPSRVLISFLTSFVGSILFQDFRDDFPNSLLGHLKNSIIFM